MANIYQTFYSRAQDLRNAGYSAADTAKRLNAEFFTPAFYATRNQGSWLPEVKGFDPLRPIESGPKDFHVCGAFRA